MLPVLIKNRPDLISRRFSIDPDANNSYFRSIKVEIDDETQYPKARQFKELKSPYADPTRVMYNATTLKPTERLLPINE